MVEVIAQEIKTIELPLQDVLVHNADVTIAIAKFASLKYSLTTAGVILLERTPEDLQNGPISYPLYNKAVELIKSFGYEPGYVLVPDQPGFAIIRFAADYAICVAAYIRPNGRDKEK